MVENIEKLDNGKDIVGKDLDVEEGEIKQMSPKVEEKKNNEMDLNQAVNYLTRKNVIRDNVIIPDKWKQNNSPAKEFLLQALLQMDVFGLKGKPLTGEKHIRRSFNERYFNLVNRQFIKRPPWR